MADDWVLQDDDDEEKGEKKSGELGQEESKLMERFLRTRTTLISEPITDAVARRVYQNLLLLEDADPEAPITVIINSPGGEADSGFGVMDMMKFVKCPVRTIVAGLCASAAVLVALSADKENRLSLPNSRFLLHQPMAMSFGQASDLEIASTEILRLRDRYNKIVAEATGKDIEQVAQDSDRDFWMSSSQAQEYGLVSRIISSRSELD
jgi:ATP-dependent Clp protease protease subunit